jgi:protein-S-isoprenylcysteine O-methyltransferase Ste14
MSAAWMSAADLGGAAAVYVPLTAAVIARLVHGPRPRQFAACLLSLLWTVPALLTVQIINAWAGWWIFPEYGIGLHGMPIECLFGWAVLWGLLPQLVFPRLGIPWVGAVMTVADLVFMPLCGSVVRLGPYWLVGESVAAIVVLAPALCVARWTYENTHLRARAAIQIATSGMLFLFLVPEIVFALRGGRGWATLSEESSWLRQIGIQMVLLLAVPGVSAVTEFAERGGGTPIPYDPPQRLVTSGIYRYCANPMQMSCAMVMLLWAAMLQSGWLAVGALMSAIYSAGVARWDESQDLDQRFGEAWRSYRAAVHDWRVRWRPYHAGENAHLYIAASCGPCSEVRRWIEARRPIDLQIVDADTLSPGSIRRMRYDPADGSAAVDGVRAMGRALEHLNFGWAFAGAVLRLPGVWQCVQLLMDASGFGPRELISTVCERP